MAYGLGSAGFTRPTLSQIISEKKQTYKDRFGQNINVEENSYLDKIITIEAEREYSLWELMENVYYAQTLVGAEGKYLDDILSKQGSYRKGATKSSGTVFVGLDKTAPYLFEFVAGVYSINAGTYINTSDVVVRGNIIAQQIKSTDLSIGDYTFTITDTSGIQQTLNLTLTNISIGSTQLNSFYNTIRDFIVTYTTTTNEDLIQVDTLAGILYVGYNTDLELIGLSYVTDFEGTSVGIRYVPLEFQAISAGLQYVLESSITSISPTPSGYVSATNPHSFYSGSDVESDAEYRARSLTPDSTGKATRSAIINGLYSAVNDLQKVKLFPNATGVATEDGIPPYSLHIVTYGGTASAIGEAIYTLIASPTNTYGSLGYTVQTEDGGVETVYHTPATEKRIALQVSYKPVNNKQLSTSEKTAISKALLKLADTFDINTTIFNLQLEAAVVSGVNISRFSQLVVEYKLVDDPSSVYSDDDIQTSSTELCTLLESNITFLQLS